MDRLRDHLQPVSQYTPHHPGDRLSAQRIEREQPDFAKAHAEVMRQQRLEQIAQADRAAKAAQAERIAQYEKAERAQAERVAAAREKSGSRTSGNVGAMIVGEVGRWTTGNAAHI